MHALQILTQFERTRYHALTNVTPNMTIGQKLAVPAGGDAVGQSMW